LAGDDDDEIVTVGRRGGFFALRACDSVHAAQQSYADIALDMPDIDK
jgi:hypothetical protein